MKKCEAGADDYVTKPFSSACCSPVGLQWFLGTAFGLIIAKPDEDLCLTARLIRRLLKCWASCLLDRSSLSLIRPSMLRDCPNANSPFSYLLRTGRLPLHERWLGANDHVDRSLEDGARL